MKQDPRRQRPATRSPADPLRGTPPEPEVDRQFDGSLPTAERSQEPSAAPTCAPRARRQPPEPDQPDALRLPPGAWLAARKSGGLLFSSREIAVHDDGRLTASAVGGGRSARTSPPRVLTSAQLAALRHAVARLDIHGLPATAGIQRPDTYVYEIAVRAGRSARTIEVAEGQVPPPLAPLVQQLNQLLSTVE